MKKTVWVVCLIAVCVVLVLSGTEIYKILSAQVQNEIYYDGVKSACFSEVPADSAADPDAENTAEQPPAQNTVTVDFKKLEDENKNTVGWLYLPGTRIDYPVVQGTDNLFYLSHLANGKKNINGALFADYRNQPDFSDYNTVIYGHYMKSHTMFGMLPNYKKQSFYDDHKIMYLYTDRVNYTLELVCGFSTTGTSDFYLVPANAALTREWLDYGIKNSTFVSNVTVGEGDRLVTLSTCSASPDGDRYVVMAKLVPQ